MEEINNLDETKLLGYFESIRSVFFLKFIFLLSFLKEKNGKTFIDGTKIPLDALNQAKKLLPDPVFYEALNKGNEELYLNFLDDMLTSLITSSWNVFEQITKDLSTENYATQKTDLKVCYENSKFQFDTREKKDLKLFYYIRNAICHYNGAYYSFKEIDHHYKDNHFNSIGHHGEKIDITLRVAWEIACDIEKHSLKAYKNGKISTSS